MDGYNLIAMDVATTSIGFARLLSFFFNIYPGKTNWLQTCQVSCIRRETRAFDVYLTLSCLRLKSHAFVSVAVMFFSGIASVIFHYYYS